MRIGRQLWNTRLRILRIKEGSMEKYEVPEIKIIWLDATDVITTSNPDTQDPDPITTGEH